MFTCSGDPEIEEKLAGLNAEVAKRISAARAEGYREALEEVQDTFKDMRPSDEVTVEFLFLEIQKLKSAYEKGSDGNGKTTE